MSIQELITLSEAARFIPGRNSKRVHVNTLRRWIIQGCRGVRLKAERRGGLWLTTREWIHEFMRACADSALARKSTAVDVVSVREEDERTAAILRRFGLDGCKETEMSRLRATNR